MSIFNLNSDHKEFDVIICGGGAAGLLVARQLKLQYGAISILILEKDAFPHDHAAFKVGESTVELAGQYLSKHAQLDEYLKSNHLIKFGLRYFWGEDHQEFGMCPELGLKEYPTHDHFQIDRGIFENDLYSMNLSVGIEIIQSAKVNGIHINGEHLHQVVYSVGGKEEKNAYSRWIVDASGRRRLLQNKLDLKKNIDPNCSSFWFRVKGELHIDYCVSGAYTEWHERITGGKRYYSTTHLMGPGYWIWIIPLSSGNTSIGIVADETINPFNEFNTLVKALSWIERHQPAFYNVLKGYEVLDTLLMRKYSYSSKQIFSEERWVCIGEAAVFPDPFYSPGFNLISYECMMVVDMVEADRKGLLKPEKLRFYNDFILSQNEWITHNIHSSYKHFGSHLRFSLINIWDLTVDWSLANPQMFNLIFLDTDKSAKVRKITAGYPPIHFKIKKLFDDWANYAGHRLTFDYINYYGISFIKDLRDLTLKGEWKEEALYDNHRKNMKVLEAIAISIFLLAVEDTMPEKLQELIDKRWLNASAISLSHEDWEKDGLFTIKTEPGDFHIIWREMRNLYRIKYMLPASEKETKEISISLDL